MEDWLAYPTRAESGRPTDAAYAALCAGEPKRARQLLAEAHAAPGSPDASIVSTLSTWCIQADSNWYPGGIGSEIPEPYAPADIAVQDDWAAALALLVNCGPPAMWTYRLLLPQLVGTDDAATADQLADDALHSLQQLIDASRQSQLWDQAAWGMAAQADIADRAGRHPAAAEHLTRLRTAATDNGLPLIAAYTLLTVADWLLTPGSSPEALGYQLPTMRQDAAAADLPAADGALAEAERLAATAGPTEIAPALWSGLHLRRATLAWLRDDHSSRRSHLEQARQAAESAGLVAARQLIDVHLLIADLAEGRWAGLLDDIGSGWQLSVSGRLRQIRDWAADRGSTSWCLGLGRLLERVGDGRRARGDDESAALAYLGARLLQQVTDRVPTATLVTAVADLDWRRNLIARACVRLERVLAGLPAAADPRTQTFDFLEFAEVSVGIDRAQRQRARGPATEYAVRALQRSQSRLSGLLTLAGPRPLGSVNVEAMLDQIDDEVRLLDVLIPLNRADQASRLGELERAGQFYHAASIAAEQAGGYAVPMVLASAGRRTEAREMLAGLVGSLEDDLLALLALQVADIPVARAAFARTGLDPMASSDPGDLSLAAELAVSEPDPDPRQALVFARRGIELVEAAIAPLLRNTDRVAACDSAVLARLHALATRACLQLAELEGDARRAHLRSAFDFTERARSLAIDQTTAGPDQAGSPDLDSALILDWRAAAAQWAEDTDRVLLGFDDDAADLAGLTARADASEDRLRRLEQRLEELHPGRLSGQEPPGRTLTAAQAQARLPAGSLVIEYHTVGEDLTIVALGPDQLAGAHRPVVSRELSALVANFHSECQLGSAGGESAAALAGLVLEPVRSLVEQHNRLIIVPFGPLNLIPFHALPFDGGPLGLSKIVSYAPSAGVALAGGLDAPVRLEQPLVIGDPAFDPAVRSRLPRLPGAQVEALAVAARLQANPLIEQQAGEDIVRPRLPGSRVLHLATHGVLDELVPYGSALVLAGPDELTVAELVGLHVGADLAVLSACDTGRGATTLGGDVVGLTRAMLAAGVRQTVVSLWPVDDHIACLTMAHFYDALRSMPAAAALQAAQQRIHGLDEAAVREAFAALATEVGRSELALTEQFRRRSEYADEEEIPPPLGGSAERWWAPFILVG